MDEWDLRVDQDILSGWFSVEVEICRVRNALKDGTKVYFHMRDNGLKLLNGQNYYVNACTNVYFFTGTMAENAYSDINNEYHLGNKNFAGLEDKTLLIDCENRTVKGMAKWEVVQR